MIADILSWHSIKLLVHILPTYYNKYYDCADYWHMRDAFSYNLKYSFNAYRKLLSFKPIIRNRNNIKKIIDIVVKTDRYDILQLMVLKKLLADLDMKVCYENDSVNCTNLMIIHKMITYQDILQNLDILINKNSIKILTFISDYGVLKQDHFDDVFSSKNLLYSRDIVRFIEKRYVFQEKYLDMDFLIKAKADETIRELLSLGKIKRVTGHLVTCCKFDSYCVLRAITDYYKSYRVTRKLREALVMCCRLGHYNTIKHLLDIKIIVPNDLVEIEPLEKIIAVTAKSRNYSLLRLLLDIFDL